MLFRFSKRLLSTPTPSGLVSSAQSQVVYISVSQTHRQCEGDGVVQASVVMTDTDSWCDLLDWYSHLVGCDADSEPNGETFGTSNTGNTLHFLCLHEQAVHKCEWLESHFGHCSKSCLTLHAKIRCTLLFSMHVEPYITTCSIHEGMPAVMVGNLVRISSTNLAGLQYHHPLIQICTRLYK